jgi:enamine deaminase RidA (YjgF/YER057c/UK114 family)
MVQGINPEGLWQPLGRGFSQAVVQPPGRVVHVTGQVALDADNRVFAPGDALAQARVCFEHCRKVLAAVGGTLDDVVSLTVMYVDPVDLPAIQQARSEVYVTPNAPVSTLYQVAGLMVPGLLVEVVPVAVVPDARVPAGGV